MTDYMSDGSIETDRDNHLWLDLWRTRQTNFHQKKVNKFLSTYWPGLNLTRGSRVFVPLCGKSLDMTWLAKQGHEVIGVELSTVAVKAFFRENQLKPIKRRLGKYTLWRHGRISILCGDYFSLNKDDLGHIDTVYDRAALTALPEEIRKRYAMHLQLIVPQADIFLLTVEDIVQETGLSQDPDVDKEINTLFSEEFDITLTHVETGIETDHQSPEKPPIKTEYKVYQLAHKSAIKNS